MIFSNILYIRACEVGGKSDSMLVQLWHPSLNAYSLNYICGYALFFSVLLPRRLGYTEYRRIS